MLVYLASQIRQASKLAKSTSTNQARAGVSDAPSPISSDTEAVKTYTKGMIDPDSLELHERVRFDHHGVPPPASPLAHPMHLLRH